MENKRQTKKINTSECTRVARAKSKRISIKKERPGVPTGKVVDWLLMLSFTKSLALVQVRTST